MEAGEFYSFWFTIVSIERCRRMCKMNSIRFNNEKIKFPTCLPALGALVKLIAQTALVEEQVPFIATGKTIERERERITRFQQALFFGKKINRVSGG